MGLESRDGGFYDAPMLDPILASVRTRLPAVIAREAALVAAAALAPPALRFASALQGPGLAVVAEVKRRSPSAGPMAPDLDVAAIAEAYRAGGAAALSILTEPDHFGALPGDLAEARATGGLPVLRKDFILHPAQVWEARAMGADAVLLIAAILDDATLTDLMGVAAVAGLDVLVEVHSAEEAVRADAAGAVLVGVNNRDLTTFVTDLSTAERLRDRLPEGCIAVAESGVSSPEGAARMLHAGYDAVLVGEAAVRASDPAGFVAALRAVT